MSFRLLIVASKAAALNSVVQYLQNRRWEIIVCEELKEALEKALAFKPDLVLLAADHPNKKVTQLPQILQQLGKFPVVGYVESNSHAAIQALNSMPKQYEIYPPLSGVMIERAAQRIEREARQVSQKRREGLEDFGSIKLVASASEVALDAATRTDLEHDVPQVTTESLPPTPLQPTYRHELRLYPADDSVFARGLQLVLSQQCSGAKASQYEAIEYTSNFACITIQSEQFSGYLLAAMGNNRKISNHFIESIKFKLREFLKLNGNTQIEAHAQAIEISGISFEDWSAKQAQFLRKAVHDAKEVALAFFEDKKLATKVETSSFTKMMMMHLDEFEPYAIVNFDLYVYMPANQRLLLYTPAGGHLASNQVERLKAKGVSHLHFSEDAKADALKYVTGIAARKLAKSFQSSAAPVPHQTAA